MSISFYLFTGAVPEFRYGKNAYKKIESANTFMNRIQGIRYTRTL